MQKTIIAGTLLALLLAAVFVGLGIADVRAETRPDQVVERFYGSWIAARAAGESGPFDKRLHEKSTYVTTSFGQEIARAKENGEDGVLCGTDDLSSFAVEQMLEREDGKSASVIFTVRGAVGRVVLVPDHRSWWRIDEVDCQRVGQ